MHSKGQCHGIFLLSRVIKFKVRKDIAEWVESARNASTLMAMAINLEEVAHSLVRLGLASRAEYIVLDKGLLELTELADRKTLIAIAARLIMQDPPFWLKMAVKQGVVFREYIPTSALQNLDWIGEDLDEFLLSVRYSLSDAADDGFIKVFGDVAEDLIFSGLKKMGLEPTHVSKMSDSYGYDIEYSSSIKKRVEVKAASEKTVGQFHVSRNEFDKSILHSKEWILVQLIFNTSAFSAKKISHKHVKEIIELRSGSLSEIAPSDTENFRWNGTALIIPRKSDWISSSISLDSDFETEGFRARLEIKRVKDYEAPPKI